MLQQLSADLNADKLTDRLVVIQVFTHFLATTLGLASISA